MMTVEEMIKVMQDYQSGETIAYRPIKMGGYSSDEEGWTKCDHPPVWDFFNVEYKTVATEKIIAYPTKNSFINATTVHGFLIENKATGIAYTVLEIDNHGVEIVGPMSRDRRVIGIGFRELVDDYVWALDKSPCGITVSTRE